MSDKLCKNDADVKFECSREILQNYIESTNIDVLKQQFAIYQELNKQRCEHHHLFSMETIAESLYSFNIAPRHSFKHYLTGVLTDDNEAILSDWKAVGEDLSHAWIETKLSVNEPSCQN